MGNIEKKQFIRATKDLLKKYKDGNLKLDECAEQIYALQYHVQMEAAIKDWGL